MMEIGMEDFAEQTRSVENQSPGASKTPWPVHELISAGQVNVHGTLINCRQNKPGLFNPEFQQSWQLLEDPSTGAKFIDFGSQVKQLLRAQDGNYEFCNQVQAQGGIIEEKFKFLSAGGNTFQGREEIDFIGPRGIANFGLYNLGGCVENYYSQRLPVSGVRSKQANGITETGVDNLPAQVRCIGKEGPLGSHVPWGNRELVPAGQASVHGTLTQCHERKPGLFNREFQQSWQILQDPTTGAKFIDCGNSHFMQLVRAQDGSYQLCNRVQAQGGIIQESFKLVSTGGNTFQGREEIDFIGPRGIANSGLYNLGGCVENYYSQRSQVACHLPLPLPNSPEVSARLKALMYLPGNQFHIYSERPYAKTS